jgi:hypothetical protein
MRVIIICNKILSKWCKKIDLSGFIVVLLEKDPVKSHSFA